MWKDIKITFVKGENSSHEEYLLFDKSQPNIYASMAEVMTSIESKLDFISKTILQDYLVDTGICEINQRIKESYLSHDDNNDFRYSQETYQKLLDKYNALELATLKPNINRAVQEYEASEYFGQLMDSLKLIFLQKSAIDLSIKNFIVYEKEKSVNVAKTLNPSLKNTASQAIADLKLQESFNMYNRNRGASLEVKLDYQPNNKKNEDSQSSSNKSNEKLKLTSRELSIKLSESNELEENPKLKNSKTFQASSRSNSKNPEPVRKSERINSSSSSKDNSIRGTSRELYRLKTVVSESRSRESSFSREAKAVREKDRSRQSSFSRERIPVREKDRSRESSFSRERIAVRERDSSNSANSAKSPKSPKSTIPSRFKQNDFEEDHHAHQYEKSHHKAIERRVDEIMTRRKRKEAILKELKEQPGQKGWFRDACQCVMW